MKELTNRDCFSICGDYLTKILRDLVLEDKWEHSLKTASECILGISTDQAITILKGEYKLTGNSQIGMGYEKEDPEIEQEHKERIQKYYCGRCKLGRSDLWFEPYAIVGSYCAADIKGPSIWAEREISLRPERGNDGFKESIVYRGDWGGSDWAYGRAMYYAHNPMSDRAYVLQVREEDIHKNCSTVLFRVCPSRPIWCDYPKNAQAAVLECEANGKSLHVIEIEPFIKSYNDEFKPKSVVDSEETILDKTQTFENLVPGHLKHIAKDIAKGLSGEQDFESVVEKDVELNSLSGYILPDGEFYGCGYMEHPALATRILKHVFNVEGVDDPQKEADNRGWLRIQRQASNDIALSKSRKLTQRQIDKMFDFITKYCFINDDIRDFIEPDNFGGYIILEPKTLD